MEQTKYIQSTKCSDWGDTWGLGTSHLGKLSRTGNDTYPYQWKGTRQGRHNQVFQKTFTIVFNYTKEVGFVMHPKNKYNNLPTTKHVLDAIDVLNTPIEPPKPKQAKQHSKRFITNQSENQLSLL